MVSAKRKTCTGYRREANGLHDKEVSSFSIFVSFVKTLPDGSCDATAVLERDCYLSWLESRRCEPKNAHEAFRRAVTAHIRGNDGRRPFPKEAEESLLKELRKKKQWKAFEGTGLLVGIKGFSSLGHHEKRALFQMSKKNQNTKEKSIFTAQRNVRERLLSQRKRENKNVVGIKLEENPTKVVAPVASVYIKKENQPLPFVQRKKTKSLGLDRGIYPSDFAANQPFASMLFLKEMSDAFTPHKSCKQEKLGMEGLDAFNPLLDEMIDLCDDSLDGNFDLSTVFEKSRISELLI